MCELPPEPPVLDVLPPMFALVLELDALGELPPVDVPPCVRHVVVVPLVLHVVPLGQQYPLPQLTGYPLGQLPPVELLPEEPLHELVLEQLPFAQQYGCALSQQYPFPQLFG